MQEKKRKISQKHEHECSQEQDLSVTNNIT